MEDTGNIFVIDASIILAWLLPKEKHQKQVDNLFLLHTQKTISLTVPTLCTYEVVNGIKSAILRKRITIAKTPEILEKYQMLEIEELKPVMMRLFELSYQNNISVYDAAYVELAQRKGWSFYTADEKLYDKLKGKLSFVKFIADFK